MALTIWGQVIIQASTPQEDPVQVGTLWIDTSGAATLKVCTAISPYTFATITGSSTSPGGSNTQVQFNDGGVFGGDAGFTYDKATDRLRIGAATTTEKLTLTETGVRTIGIALRSDDGSVAGFDFTAGRIQAGWEIGEIEYAEAFLKFNNPTGENAYTTALTLKGGNVGIGGGAIATSPIFPLEIQPSSPNVNAVARLIRPDATRESGIRFRTGVIDDFFIRTFTTSDLNIHCLGTATNVLTILRANGRVGLQRENPTATLHIKAGNTGANTAPIKLTAGAVNTTPEAGAIEFDGTNLYFTDSGGTRRQLAVV